MEVSAEEGTRIYTPERAASNKNAINFDQMAKTARIKSSPQNGALGASLSQD